MNRCSRIYSIHTLTLLLAMLGCGDRSPEPTEVLPSLETIPYQALGNSGKIAFQRTYWQHRTGSGVYVVDVAQKKFSLAPVSVLAADPVISPDGQQIAFTAFSSGDFAFDVFTIRLDGGGQVRLSRLDGQDGAPSWTPDGSAVVALAQPWSRGSLFPPPYVYRQPLASPQRAETLWSIPFRRSDLDPVPAVPEGRVSVSTQGIFSFNTLDRKIYTFILPDRLALIHSVQDPEELRGVAWSPDGQQIAFLEIVRTGGVFTTTRVRLLSWPAGNLSTVAEVASSSFANQGVGHTNLTLCWLGSDRIVFVNPEGGADTPFSHIYVVQKDGSNLVQITNAPAVTDRSVSCSASP